MSIEITSTTDSAEAVALVNSDAAPAEKEVTKQSAPVSEKESDETLEASETSEDAADESSDESSDESEDESEAKDEAKPKKQSGFQKKVSKLTKRAHESERERDYWKAEALKAKEQSEPKRDAAPAKETAPGKPSADDFDTHSEYVEALSDWKVEQKLNERENKAKQAEALTEFEKRVQATREKSKAFAEKTPDFREVIEDMDDIRLSPILEDAFLDGGPELMYAMAKDRAELERINALPAVQAAREIGKFEARLVLQKETPQAEKKLQTKAPTPIKTVGSNSSSVVRKSIYDESLSQREYEKLREKQLGG